MLYNVYLTVQLLPVFPVCVSKWSNI